MEDSNTVTQIEFILDEDAYWSWNWSDYGDDEVKDQE